MLKLPYGVSSFDKLARDEYYFVDRTAYIAQLEQLVEPYLFFLRPRRFGKSLFISLLQCYYGLEYLAGMAMFANFMKALKAPLATAWLIVSLSLAFHRSRWTA